MALAPATTKRCPGYAPGGIDPHELPATSEHFVSNKGNRDGLATRCKTCGKAYQQGWSAAKKAGEQFSARRPRVIEQASAAIRASNSIEEAEDHLASAAVALSNEAAERQRQQPAPIPAARGPRADQHGWSTTRVAGVEYPLPTDAATVATDEGQQALDHIARAKRAQGAQAKRDQRARAKAEAAAQA